MFTPSRTFEINFIRFIFYSVFNAKNMRREFQYQSIFTRGTSVRISSKKKKRKKKGKPLLSGFESFSVKKTLHLMTK